MIDFPKLLIYFPGIVQQREAVAAGDRPIRVREREQTAGGKQVRPHRQTGRRHSGC